MKKYDGNEVAMAGKKRRRQTKKRTRGGWIALKIIFALVAALGMVFGYAALNANTVHVRYAEVTLKDLPQAFDGCRVLFVSDIDLCGINTPEKAAKLFKRLKDLRPDVLLLGGDYTSNSVIDILNQSENSAESVQQRAVFLRGIADFEAPLGKFAVAGDNDADVEGLMLLMEETGIEPLFNGHAAVKKDGDALHIVGFNANTTGVNFNKVANAFSKKDCVIALTHSPSAFPQMLTAEAKDSGAWADLMLAGHTHGGQIRLGDRNIIRLSGQELDFLYGWKRESETIMLTTSGLGCEGTNLRLGTESEVWLITLSDGSVNLPDLST